MGEERGLYIKTYGCQMNAYDSQRMEQALLPLGFKICEDMEAAEVIIFNTCHIRAKAENKVFSDLGRARDVKNRRRAKDEDTIIVLAGCVAQALGEETFKRNRAVDVVVGPQTYHSLPETVTKILREQVRSPQKYISLGFDALKKFDELPHVQGMSGASAFLSIQEGCNKFCRYCVVPFTRGPEVSRPVHDVLAEARHLISLGARELTLLGQNVNAYHGQDADGKTWRLGRLLRALGDMPELVRLRYTTSHPRDVDQELIEAHRDVPSVMPFLHLPVQSGSNRVLAHMNRRHTREFYLKIIEDFRKVRPDMAFSSDFIVGYVGEEERDFQETCDLIRQVQFAQAYSFAYSPRPGTAASLMTEEVVSDGIKKERLHQIQELLDQQRWAFNQKFLGSSMDVMVEDTARGKIMARSAFMHTVHVPGEITSVSKGQMLRVSIEKASLHSLTAEQGWQMLG